MENELKVLLFIVLVVAFLFYSSIDNVDDSNETTKKPKAKKTKNNLNKSIIQFSKISTIQFECLKCQSIVTIQFNESSVNKDNNPPSICSDCLELDTNNHIQQPSPNSSKNDIHSYEIDKEKKINSYVHENFCKECNQNSFYLNQYGLCSKCEENLNEKKEELTKEKIDNVRLKLLRAKKAKLRMKK